MKKLFTFLFLTAIIAIMFAQGANAQVTVTNPANVGPTALASTYTTLALAITDLNTKASISGPVIITLNAGNPQTTPQGGYSITAILTGASATNTLTIAGSGNTITAYTPQVTGQRWDAIFKIIGGDYITISGFTMQENSANTVSTFASNTMTEFGVALFAASTTDGA